MTKRRSMAASAFLALITLGGGRGVWGQVPSVPARMTLDDVVKNEVKQTLDALEADGKFDAAQTRLSSLFDQVALTGSDKSLDAFSDSAFALRMINQLHTLPAAKRLDLLAFLRANDALARSLVFLINDDQQAPGAYAMLNRLRQNNAPTLNTFATLAAAICVVHDQPFTRHINEHLTASPDPVALYNFYTNNEKLMLFGIRNVPAELLVYVVDTTSPIPEMQWTLRKYAGDAMIARHFFDVTYDYNYFKGEQSKKVDTVAYSLPNILKYGGVCADQAFFAMEIGKAIGVPTTYTTASSAEVGHAWTGFLQATSDRLVWNFNVGRYEEYRGIRGDVEDPQTRKDIPDSYVSLLAELMGTKAHRIQASDRQASIALSDAALRIAAAAVNQQTTALSAEANDLKATDTLHQPRKITIDAALDLLQSALKLNIANRPAWFLVASLAADGKLTNPQKAVWSNVLLQRCGDKYPDFALTVVAPMVGTVDDPIQQNNLWNVVFNKFQARADLAAEVRMYQARLWKQQNQPARAMQCYLDIINRYSNAGPFVLDALEGADELLAKDLAKEAALYQQSWGKIQKPEDMAGPFMQQSNWFRVGAMYAQKLQAAGNTQLAETVLAQLGMGRDAKK